MKFRYWQPVPLDLPLKHLTDTTVLALSDDDALVLHTYEVVRDTSPFEANLVIPQSLRVKYWRPSRTWSEAEVVFSPTTPIADVLNGRLNGVRHLLVIPPVRMKRRQLLSQHRPAVIVGLLPFALPYAGTLPMVGLLLIVGVLLMIGVSVTGGLRPPVVQPSISQSRTVPVINIPGQGQVSLAEAVDYGRARISGVRPELALRAERETAANHRVEAIRKQYQLLEMDVVQRIEQPALFDQAVTPTAEFLTALRNYPHAESLADKEQTAADVERTFAVALEHARALGLRHFPEHARDDARRAANAARLAAGASTEGERQAAMTQVRRILDALALYYLPTINERLQIEAPHVEPAPSPNQDAEPDSQPRSETTYGSPW